MNFDEAVEIIISLEGPPTNDPGGKTKWGIYQRAFPKKDIMALTKEDAKNIYFIHYWEIISIGDLPDNIRLIFFDCSINQGPKTAAIILQEIVGVEPDGFIGPITLEAIRNYPRDLKMAYLIERAFIYSKTKKYGRYGRGLLNRLKRVA